MALGRTAKTAIAIALIGVTGSIIGSMVVGSRQASRLDARRAELTEGVADAVAAEIDAAAVFVEDLAKVPVNTHLTGRQFVDSFEIANDGSILAGDVEAAATVEVERDEIAAFATSEQQADPDFATSYLNGDPGLSHAILIGATPASMDKWIGADLRSFFSQLEAWRDYPEGRAVLGAGDLADPASADLPLQLRVRTTALGVDGVQRPAWLAVQLDAEAHLARAGLDDGVGVSLTLPSEPGLRIDHNPRAGDAEPVGETRLESLVLASTEVEIRSFANDTIRTGTTAREILMIGLAITLAVVGLFLIVAAVSALVRHLRERVRQATTDELTGLPNRRRLLDHIEEGIEPQSGRDQPAQVTAMFCDLDRFKLINDTFGHDFGDRLLVEVAERLASAIPEDAVLARFGSDEFVVIAPGTIPTDATGTASSLIDALSNQISVDGRMVSTSLSIGIATTAELTEPSCRELLRRADTALYRAKDAGGGTFALYRPEDEQNAQERHQTEQDLIAAVGNDELTVVYQPILDRDYRVMSVEALVRWPHPTRGTIAPGEFLDVAREIGLIPVLGAQVLRRACHQLSQWRSETGRRDLRINVNMDPRQLHEADFVDLVREILDQAGLPGRNLILEVTEEMLSSLDDLARGRLEELRAMGIGISIDDFGAGHSSLTRLIELGEVAELKIDRGIVGRATDPKGLAIISAVVSMAEVLNLRVVAEGIERDDEEAAVIALGVEGLQGYRFAMPMPAESVILDQPLLEIEKFGSGERVAAARNDA